MLKVRVSAKCFKMPPDSVIAGFDTAGIVWPVKEVAVITGYSALWLPPLAAGRIKAYQ